MKIPTPICIAAILTSLLFVNVFGQAGTPKISTEADIARDMQSAPCKNSDRLDAVGRLFESVGAARPDMAVTDKKGTRNLVITRKGTGEGTVVVGAHYDKVGDGCGALDNWTGIVAMAHLYRTLRDVSVTKTFLFVAFDKEESGLLGSRTFVDQIPKDERPRYCAMVNVDSFGLAQPQVMENTSSRGLTAAAKDLWTQMNLKLSVARIENADADSSSFLSAGIPAITFHGMTNEWPKFLHTEKDKLSNVKLQSVFFGYRFVLPFLVVIDNASCDAFRTK